MKPIAGPNIEPFGLGGFCVTGANIDGVSYSSLNIYQQRSSVMFDLIDGNGIVHDFIELVHVDANNQLLDPNETTAEIQGKIAKNTFFIKTQDPHTLEPIFVFQYQTNLIKLSNGAISFKPWEYINFCNATDENQINKVDATKSTLTADPTSVPADGHTESTVTLTVRDDTGAILNAIDSGVVFTATGLDDGKYIISAVDYSQKASGIITVTVKAIEGGTLTVSAKVGNIDITQTAQINFTGSGLDVVDPDVSTVTATSPVVADFVSTSLITITLKDSYSNPITDVQAAFVSLSASGFTSTDNYEFSALDTSNSASGIYTVTLKSKKPITTQITAVVRGVTLTQKPSIVFQSSNAPSPGGIMIRSSKILVPINLATPNADASTTTITLSVNDQYGNPVQNLSSSTTLGMTGAFDSSRYTISSINTSDAVNGNYTFTVYSVEAADVTFYPIIPALGSLPNINTMVGFTWRSLRGETGVPVMGKTTVRTVGDGTYVANGYDAAYVIIDLGTINSRICNNVTATGNNKLTFSQINGVSYSSLDYTNAGVGEVTLRITSVVPGDYDINIYSNNVIIATLPLTFVVGPVDDAKTTFTASPVTAKMNGTGNETLSTFTITKKDMVGNPIPITADEISISATGFNSSADYTISSWTINGNVANATVTSKMAVTGTFTATLGSTVIKQTPSVKFMWDELSGTTGPAAPDKTTFLSGHTTIKNDGIDAAALYIWLYGSDELLVAGYSASDVEFYVVSPALDASEYTIRQPSDTFESYGRGGFNGNFACTKGGIEVIVGVKVKGVVATGHISTITVEETIIISPTASTLYASGPIDDAGVGRFSNITFYPRDTEGKTVKTITDGKVKFTCSDPDAVFTYDYSQAANGLITGTMECPNVGTVEVTASVGSVNVGPVEVDVLNWTTPDKFNSYLEIESPVQVGKEAIAKLTVLNYNGNPVKLYEGDANMTAQSTTSTTFSAGAIDYSQSDKGIYTMPFSSDAPNELIIRAGASGLLLNAQADLVVQSDAVTPALSTVLVPRFLNTHVDETFEFTVDFSGINIDSSVKTGSWTISDSSAVQFISNSGTTFKAIAKKVGVYTLTFYPDATPNRTATATLYIIESNRYRTATFGFEALTKKLPWSIMNEGNMPNGIPINSGTEAVFSLNFSPSNFVPAGPAAFTAERYNPSTGTLAPWDVPFTLIGTPDNLNHYVRFDKGWYGIFRITMTPGTSLAYGDMVFNRTFTVVLLNPDGLYAPKLTVSPKLQCKALNAAMRVGEVFETSMYASWSWSTTLDLSKMKELPYPDEVEWVSSLPSVAKFDKDGVLTGVSNGSTGLEVKYKDYPTNLTMLGVSNLYPYRVTGYNPPGFRVPEFNVPCTPSPISYPNGSTEFSITSNSTDSAVTINPDKSITVKSTIYLRPIAVNLNFTETMPVNLKRSGEAQLLNPNATNATISSISLATSRVNFPYTGFNSNEQFKVGEILNIAGTAASSYGGIQEDYIINIDDPTILEQYTPYYCHGDLNVMNDSSMFRAIKSGVCTVSIFYPKSNLTTSTDVTIVANAAPSPYAPPPFPPVG